MFGTITWRVLQPTRFRKATGLGELARGRFPPPWNSRSKMDFQATLLPYAWLWWTAAFLYNPAINTAQACAPALKQHRAFLKTAWGVWNLAFSLFSAAGLAGTGRTYLAMLGEFSSLCAADSLAAAAFWNTHFTSGPTHTWVLLFIVSKLLELGDTLFLAVLGKPIIFLHWYHHLTILVYMYVGGLQWHPFMISGVACNYCVHMVMYAYYASACFGIKWPKWLARNITTLQLAQMFANLALLAATFWHCGCRNHISLWPSVAMYSVYAWLFVDLFRQKYKTTGGGARSAATGSAGQDQRPKDACWKTWVTIQGWDIDITHFAAQHPGGSVITYFAGQDATAAFTEFHSNKKKATRVLETLPRRPATATSHCTAPPHADKVSDKPDASSLTSDDTLAVADDDTSSVCDVTSRTTSTAPAATGAVVPAPTTQELFGQGSVDSGPVGSNSSSDSRMSDADITADFAAWRADLVARGFFKPRTTWQLVVFLSEPLVMMFVGCWLMKVTGSVWPGVVLLGVANVRCGWIQHEAGHNSVTTNPKVDKLLQTIAIGLGLSLSGWVWNNMHNKHHAAPNKINHDIDLNTLPLVAFYKGCVEKDRRSRVPNTSSRLLSNWLKLQAYTFLPITCMLVSLFWFFFLHPIKAWKKDRLGLSILALSHLTKPLLFVTFGGTSFLQGYLLMMAAYWVTSVYLFGHFSLSHTFMPVLEESQHSSWVQQALEHSVDISPGNSCVDWVMGYLNYQVIHHLFPSMPQCNGPAISRELRAKAKQWGISYHTVSYAQAWRAMLENLDDVGRHYYHELASNVYCERAQNVKKRA